MFPPIANKFVVYFSDVAIKDIFLSLWNKLLTLIRTYFCPRYSPLKMKCSKEVIIKIISEEMAFNY